MRMRKVSKRILVAVFPVVLDLQDAVFQLLLPISSVPCLSFGGKRTWLGECICDFSARLFEEPRVTAVSDKLCDKVVGTDPDSVAPLSLYD